jgi:GxxExxY protein
MYEIPSSIFLLPQSLGILVSEIMNDPFSYAVIGKAMEVHRELGPGVDEIFYHEFLSERLRASGIEHLCRPREQLVHRGIVADIFEADLIFPGKLAAELKCLRGSFEPEHYVQLIYYLKFWCVPTGFLFDFAKDSLLHRRVNYEPAATVGFDSDSLLAAAPDLGNDRKLGTAICRGVAEIIMAHGFGYRDTTYRGLLAAEFNAEALGCLTTPTATVSVNRRPLGETRCDCLAVGGRFGIQVLALRRSITAADVAVLRNHLRLLGLPHGLILNFGKAGLDHCWIRRPLTNPSDPKIGEGQR